MNQMEPVITSRPAPWRPGTHSSTGALISSTPFKPNCASSVTPRIPNSTVPEENSKTHFVPRPKAVGVPLTESHFHFALLPAASSDDEPQWWPCLYSSNLDNAMKLQHTIWQQRLKTHSDPEQTKNHLLFHLYERMHLQIQSQILGHATMEPDIGGCEVWVALGRKPGVEHSQTVVYFQVDQYLSISDEAWITKLLEMHRQGIKDPLLRIAMDDLMAYMKILTPAGATQSTGTSMAPPISIGRESLPTTTNEPLAYDAHNLIVKKVSADRPVATVPPFASEENMLRQETRDKRLPKRGENDLIDDENKPMPALGAPTVSEEDIANLHNGNDSDTSPLYSPSKKSVGNCIKARKRSKQHERSSNVEDTVPNKRAKSNAQDPDSDNSGKHATPTMLDIHACAAINQAASEPTSPLLRRKLFEYSSEFQGENEAENDKNSNKKYLPSSSNPTDKHPSNAPNQLMEVADCKADGNIAQSNSMSGDASTQDDVMLVGKGTEDATLEDAKGIQQSTPLANPNGNSPNDSIGVTVNMEVDDLEKSDNDKGKPDERSIGSQQNNNTDSTEKGISCLGSDSHKSTASKPTQAKTDPIVDVELPGDTIREKLQSCLNALRRENESLIPCSKIQGPQTEIHRFLESVVRTKGMSGPDATVPIMHVCGAPGSGKTMSVEACCATLKERFTKEAQKWNAQPVFCYINCSHLQQMGTQEALQKTLEYANCSSERNLVRPTNESTARSTIIFLLDEVDILVSLGASRSKEARNKSEKYLQTILEWAKSERHMVGVLGISNSIENARAARLQYLGFEQGTQVVFRTYDSKDLTHIALNRIGQTVVHRSAIEFLSKRVSGSSGDARQFLELLSRSVTDVMARLKNQDGTLEKAVVRVPDVMKVVKQCSTKYTELIENSPLYEKMVLCACIHLARIIGSRPITIGCLKRICSESCEQISIEDGQMQRILTSLVDNGLLKLLNFNNRTTTQSIRFDSQLEDVEAAVEDLLTTKPVFEPMIAKLKKQDLASSIQ